MRSRALPVARSVGDNVPALDSRADAIATPIPQPSFDAPLAERFADLALANIEREYPHKPDHVLGSPADARTPRELHPAFHGSYDWHSCVHMHWLLARIRRLHPDLPQRAAIDALFDRNFAAGPIAGECAYLAGPHAQAFSRTYGWAWFLKLAREVRSASDPDARRWSAALEPLAGAFVARYLAYLPKARYPLRHGVHPNSAFGLAFALDFAVAAGAGDLEALCREKSMQWYWADRDAPAAWEPSGADFLSPTLIEAELMRRVLQPGTFAAWLAGLLPGLADGEPATLFTPATVDDRGDPQIVHLDGLNLSRAWCWRGIAGALPAGDPRRVVAGAAAERHLRAGREGLASGDFLGEHWLASFAALAMTE